MNISRIHPLAWMSLGAALAVSLPLLPDLVAFVTTATIQLTVLALVLWVSLPVLLSVAGSYMLLRQERPARRNLERSLNDAKVLGQDLIADVDRADALRDAVDTLDVFVVEVNIERGVFVWGNRKIVDFLGRPLAGMPVQQWMSDVVTDDTRAATLEFYGTADEHGPVEHLHNRLRGSEGRVWAVVWTSLETHPKSHSAFALGRCPRDSGRD